MEIEIKVYELYYKDQYISTYKTHKEIADAFGAEVSPSMVGYASRSNKVMTKGPMMDYRVNTLTYLANLDKEILVKL